MSHITLKLIQFPETNLKVASYNREVTKDLESKLRFSTLTENNDKIGFGIEFYFEIENKDQSFSLKVKAIAHFISDQEVDETFLKSSFVRMSAPAIAFPYVRTFISNLTLNAGYEAVILPSFNFVKLAEENEGDEFNENK